LLADQPSKLDPSFGATATMGTLAPALPMFSGDVERQPGWFLFVEPSVTTVVRLPPSFCGVLLQSPLHLDLPGQATVNRKVGALACMLGGGLLAWAVRACQGGSCLHAHHCAVQGLYSYWKWIKKFSSSYWAVIHYALVSASPLQTLSRLLTSHNLP